jgi:hypothetical protein
MKMSTIMSAMVLAAFVTPVAAQDVAQGDLVSNSLGTIDNTREVTLSGSIKYVRLVGERSRIQLLVTNELGEVQEWSLEGPGVGAYTRLDRTETPFRQYDKITVVIRPIENDPAAGEIVSIADTAE